MQTSRYPSTADNQDASMKPSNKPTAGGGRRRALGDITNAVNEEESKENVTKKAQYISAAPSASEVHQPLEAAMEMAPDRAYMLRPCDDIDSRDTDNPLLVTSYVNEIYDHFNLVEKEFRVNPGYMENQDYINEKMRLILVDWLVEVHLKFKMVPESLYMTVNVIDRFLQLKQVRRSKLQLVGVAALLIAAKYEEIYPPELRDLAYITDHAYNKQEILEMETEIINGLDFNFTVPTVHSFLCRYLKAAHADRTMVQLACYLAERTLQEYAVLQYLPSTIAAASVYIARKTLRRHPWSPTLVRYTKYDEDGILPCVEVMRASMSTVNTQQQAVQRKYSNAKFGSVAKMAIIF